MTKKELIKQLRMIEQQYCTDGLMEEVGSYVRVFADCLNNNNLAGYLLETELCPSVEELPVVQKEFSTAEGIIKEFKDMYQMIEGLGMVWRKE